LEDGGKGLAVILQVEPGVFSVIEDGIVREARVDGNTVTIGGRRYEIKQAGLVRAGEVAHGGAVKSPMPGKIVRVLVGVGDEVAAGQGVIVVEAMKMQNELKTPRAGRVVSVSAKENDTVEAGAVLVVVE
jgi:biotin carboxyl carrier protein